MADRTNASLSGQEAVYRLHLFVAGNEPNSRRARENLHRICAEHLTGECDLQVTDVLEDFRTALDRGVFITPALLVDAPPPPVTVFGNLSNTARVLEALGLEASGHG
jgi:circadian clock protein KaiB